MLIQKVGYIFVGLSLVFVSRAFAADVCPKSFLDSQPKEQRARFLICHEEKSGVYTLHQIDDYRIDLEYFEKNGESFAVAPNARLKSVGSGVLPINDAQTKFLYQDINNDSKPEFVFRVRFERGASLIGARYENKQFHLIGFFPTQETAGVPNNFLIHSENTDIQIKDGKIFVTLDNTDDGQTSSRKGTYQLRKGGVYYLAEIK